MKKILYLVCVLVCFASVMGGCAGSNFSATYLTYSNIGHVANDITLFTDAEDISVYMEQARVQDASNEFVSKMSSYSESFFETKMLIVINVTESSGSNELTVKKLDINDTVVQVIIQRKTKSISDGSIKDWSIFIEFDSVNQIETASYKIN